VTTTVEASTTAVKASHAGKPAIGVAPGDATVVDAAECRCMPSMGCVACAWGPRAQETVSAANPAAVTTEAVCTRPIGVVATIDYCPAVGDIGVVVDNNRVVVPVR